MIQYKQFNQQTDIKQQTFASVNSLISCSSQSQATTNNVRIYSIGPFAGPSINTPDSLGTTTAGISPSGAINSFTKQFFDRWDPNQGFFNSGLGIFTLPASHTANTNVTTGRLIEVSQPTRDAGIWPDSFTGVFTYNSTTLTAVDSSADSFGINQESLTWGKLTDITNPAHVVGSIFYDDGMVLLHGGTGSASAYTSSSVTGFAFRASITGALSASTSASTIIVENLSFNPYSMLARNIYFCHLEADEFNYTSNPSAQGVSFLQNANQSTVYISTVGLFDSKQNLVAVGKVTPVIRKNPYISLILKVTLSL